MRSGSTAGCWAARGSAGRRIAPRTDVPAWLVFGVILRAADMAHVEEVQAAAGVSLLSEGFEMIDTDAIIESFARHLMTAFDRWNERGFEAIAGDYLERLPTAQGGRAPRHRRQRRPAGRSAGRQRAARADQLVDALARADWYDPQARGPKLG